MNHEPIQFLPVNKFWETARPKLSWLEVADLILLGGVIGFAGAWVLFAFIFI